MIPFVDISQWQGKYPMANDPGPMVMMKASGSDGVPDYLDSELDNNYADAKAAGKIPFLYHLPGNLDPASEARYFFDAVSPLTVGDGYALDLEPENTWSVAQVQTFMETFHSLTGVWPWVYMDISRCNAADWSPVLANCGLWIAAPSYGFSQNVPIRYTYIAQQGPIVGGVDSDGYFGSLESLKEYTYGYTPPETTTTTTTTTVAPTTTTTTTEAPVIQDTTTTTTTTAQVEQAPSETTTTTVVEPDPSTTTVTTTELVKAPTEEQVFIEEAESWLTRLFKWLTNKG